VLAAGVILAQGGFAVVSGARRLTLCLVCCVAGLVGSPAIALGTGSSSEGPPSGEGTGASSPLKSSLVVAGGLEEGQQVQAGEEAKRSSPEEAKQTSPKEASSAEESQTKVGEGSSSGGGAGTSSSLEGPLVVPGGLEEGQQAQSAEQAKLASPEAVVSREESQTKYEDLDSEQAAKTAGEAFPAVIDEPAGGPPRLPAGQHITGYVNADTAQVDLGGEEHGLVQSLVPMAIQTSSGGWSPVNLGLSEVGGAFVPANPLVAVRVPKRLGEGVQASASGLSLTPVDGSGSPLVGSEGVVDGATVFFANTLTDTDTVVKPSALGFAMDTVLRSVQSPQQLSFRVELPEGASLVQAKDGSGAVEVIKDGVAIARIAAPVARDAAGTPVPVSMGVSGDTLTLSIDDSSGAFQYPIEVDPEFNTLNESTVSDRAWLYHETEGAGFTHGGGEIGGVWVWKGGADSPGQRAELYYKTNGDSKVYAVSAGLSLVPTQNELFLAEARVYLELEGSGGYENSLVVASSGNKVEYAPHLCSSTGCSSASGAEHNLVRLADEVTASENGGNKAELQSATVSLSQPKETHSTVSYNTSSPELTYTAEGKEHKTLNAFYNGGWIGPNSGAIEVTSKDLGIGVAKTSLQFYDKGEGWFSPFYTNPDYSCIGVQCPAEMHEVFTYSQLKTVYEGEQLFRASANDAFEHTSSSEYGEGEHEIKIDATPPHGIALTGLPGKGEELELGEVEAHVKVEATDGEGSVASSGIKSITLGIDGKEIGNPAGYCPLGPCTATGEWSINGAELGVGTYTLTVVATDNAGNVASKNYVLSVYHASPVAMGPGSVNPESGDFALGATDVDLSGGAGALAVTRHYDSRNPREGEESPLGPQWTLSLGSLASLEVLPDGSVMVVGPEGLTHFSVKKGGGFEAPAGDTNLTLEYESENKEYLLKDAAKGTTTGFTLPSGAKSWMPTISKGPVATDTVTDTYQSVETGAEYSLPTGSLPYGITQGPDGNLWYTSYGTQKISKITQSGAVTGYPLLEGSYDPYGITQGPGGDLWFTDYYSNKVGKITTAGAITEYSLGTGGDPYDIAEGPEGNLWYADYYTSKIGKITPSGAVTEYPLPKESYPVGIAQGPEGNLWYTDAATSMIGKITPSGTMTEYSLPEKSDPLGIAQGPDGNLWFTEARTNKIGKITTSGTITEYALPTGSFPYNIAQGPDGNLWFTDYESSKIGKITTSGTITESPLPAGSHPVGITQGPEGNLWYTEPGSNKIGMTTTSGRAVEPKLELAPHAAASCPAGEWEKWEKACRGLEFVYAEKTKENIGENEGEWGEYKGRLKEVEFIAYNPSTTKMAKTGVARYEYDRLGRLRAEWNPEISPALRTVYGYDAEGHVTSLTPPGQESWAFTYGTIPGDSSMGRLLKATRAPASAKLWKGEVPKSTEVPKLSGSAVVGVTMGVANGVWSNEPVTYAYQWKDCNLSGLECTSILGATNANYTVASSDVGHTLIAQVTATNGGGSVIAITVASATVTTTAGAYTQAVDSGNSINTVSCVPATTDCVLSDSKGNAFYATNVSTASGATWKAWGGPSGESPSQAAACPTSSLCLLADGKSTAGGYMYYATSLGGTWANAFEPSYGVDAISCASASFCIDGQGESGGYIRYSTSPGSTSWTAEDIGGSTSIKGVFCLSSSFCTAVDNVGDVYVATSTSQIESATWTKTNVDGTSALNGVACASTTSCVVVDSAGNAVDLAISEGKATATKHNIDGTNSLTAIACSGSATCVTVDNAGNVFGTKNGGETWTKVYALGDKLTSVSCASTTLCATVDTTGNVTAFNPSGGTKTEGEHYAPGPGSTVEYNVPLSGGGVPDQMTEGEVAKWGQKDNPAYATAIFPPDEPQSWPATGYKRATIDYLDSQARTVNMASPSGGISTKEYNEEDNAVTRSLSADNRAAAMNEGCISVSKKECKSAEVSLKRGVRSTRSSWPSARKANRVKKCWRATTLNTSTTKVRKKLKKKRKKPIIS
jgi:streptogramin lyase